MRRRRVDPIAEAEATPGMVAAQGGLFKNLWGAARSLRNGRVTKHARRVVRFCLVGISGVVVNMALLYVLAEAGGLNPLVAAVFATEAAILNNFLLNDRWTFSDVKPGTSWYRRALRYNSVALVGLAISVSVLAGVMYLLSLHYLVANLFAIGAGTLWNYAGSLCFTWATFTIRVPSVGVLAAPLGWGRRFIALVIAGVGRL